MARVLLVVSASLPAGLSAQLGPRQDYAVLARALNATLLDRSHLERSLIARLVARLVGAPAAQAWLAFRQRQAYEIIVTDGEHIGIPLALLLKLVGDTTTHVTIGHRISVPKKRPFFRWLEVQSHITRIVLHSRRQYDHAIAELGISAGRLALVPYQVDPDFWHPRPLLEERLICSAGLEHRDYPTLFQAVDGLDVKVVVASASHWSRQRNTAVETARPHNVEIGSFGYVDLRDLYARSAIVVVPLNDVDFQAGVTTLLEAMAMGKAVIVTHSQGQTDVVEDRRAVTRGTPVRPRPLSLLRILADQAGLALEPNGFYVPPGDALALRRAIIYLLAHPSERWRLGDAGRRAVEQFCTVDHFAERLRALVKQAHNPWQAEFSHAWRVLDLNAGRPRSA